MPATPPAASAPGAASSRPTRPAVLTAVVIIVGVAGALRLWNIGAGIPYNVGADEPQIMNRVALMMKTGDFNPHYFDYPTLTIYMNLIVACATFLAGSMRGLWSHLDQVAAPELYLTGRQFTALVGTATVALTFSAARRWGPGVGLVAAALMAVIPSHVRESHYVLTDVPTTFFTTLTFLLSLRAHESPTNRRLLWAAAAAGLAASCKYNGSMAVVMPLIVAWTSGGGMVGIARRTLAVVGVAVLAFLAGTPYAVLDLPKFLNDYATLAFIFARARPGSTGWSLYPKYLLGAMAWPALALAASGALMTAARIVRGADRVPALMLSGFTLVYYTVMAGKYQVYGRYMLPILPCLSLMASMAAVSLARALQRTVKPAAAGALIAAAVIVLPLATPAWSAIGLSRSMGRSSTIGLAYQWILANAPRDAKVAVEAGALTLPTPYQTLSVGSLLDRTSDDYASDGVTYFLAASSAFQAAIKDPQKNAETFTAYRVLLERATLVAAFDPSGDVGGPTVRVYRLAR